MTVEKQEIENHLLKPILKSSTGFNIIINISLVIIAFGLLAWIMQIYYGLGITGLNQNVFWGIYVSNFIFFIGISYAGTLISAVLRLTGAGWRTPLTRMAEQITIVGIVVGFLMILIDMGRPDRVFLVPYASRLQSTLFWDMLAVNSYLVGSLIFFYLPLIPDLAILRDFFDRQEGYGIRKKFYRITAIGYKGTEKQKEALDKAINFMSVILIPLAIMAHTVIAFIFAMTWRVGWHSTIFGPYFVVAAIFSGTAAIIMVMTILRKAYSLEIFITPRHYRNLGYVLLVLLAAYLYFTLTEYFTTVYRGMSHEMELMMEMFFGSYSTLFWFFMIFGMLIPGIMLALACWKYESDWAIPTIFTASAMIVVGMWIKRYIIIVPVLGRPFAGNEWVAYRPTWVEWAITFAGVAAFVYAFAVFTKLFPLISLWEIEEEYEDEEISRISEILKSRRLNTAEE